MNLKALIIEDEEASRLTLRNYLKEYCPFVEILGEASNIKEGYDLIQKHQHFKNQQGVIFWILKKT